MKNKSRTRTAEARKQRLLSLLQKHGVNIYEDLDHGKFPQFVIPSRSVNNIVYDKKLRQYVLGNASA
ncbi:MAG: DNA topoisomerase IV subunit A, partial [Nitrosopumilaceae archaeon]